MKKMTLKALGLYMTVFAVSGFGHAEKAHATLPEMNAQKKSPFSTTVHGGGCGCGACMNPAETSTQDNPA